MELKVRVLCRPEAAPGFALAGLRVDAAHDAAGAAALLKRLADERGVGVVLVEGALHRALPRELLARLERRGLPVIAPFPSAHWDEREAAEEVVLEILRRAIGYRVRAL